MMDCFVSCFRIKPHNNEALKVCLNLNSPSTYHFVLVRSLYRIVTQKRLNWWPQIDLVYSRSSELRALFTDTLNKVSQGCISHTPLRMIQSLTLKGKDSQGKFKDRAEEVPGYRNLLLYMVRLIHADPMLMLNVSDSTIISHKIYYFNSTFQTCICIVLLNFQFFDRTKARQDMKFKVQHWS